MRSSTARSSPITAQGGRSSKPPRSSNSHQVGAGGPEVGERKEGKAGRRHFHVSNPQCGRGASCSTSSSIQFIQRGGRRSKKNPDEIRNPEIGDFPGRREGRACSRFALWKGPWAREQTDGFAARWASSQLREGIDIFRIKSAGVLRQGRVAWPAERPERFRRTSAGFALLPHPTGR